MEEEGAKVAPLLPIRVARCFEVSGRVDWLV